MTSGSAAFLTGPAPAALQPVCRSLPPVALPGTSSPRRTPPAPAIHDWTSGRILLIQPHGVIEFGLQRILREAGYRVVGPVATATDARRLIDRGPIDVALVDLDLEPSATSAIVDLVDRAGIPVVYLSGAGEEAARERRRGRPVVEKPCTDACLLAAIREALEGRKSQVEDEFPYPVSPPPMPWPRVFPQL